MLSFSSILKALGFKTDLLPRRAYWRGSTSITRGQVAALPLSMGNATYNSIDPENDNYWGRNALELTADTNAHVNYCLVVALGTIQPGAIGQFAIAGELDVYVGVGQNGGSDLTAAAGQVLTSFKNINTNVPGTYADRTLWTRPAVGTGSHDDINAPAAVFGVVLETPPASASPALKRCAFNGMGILHMRGGGA